MCSKCGQKVSGEGTGCTAMEKLFHIKCFLCDKCGEQISVFIGIPVVQLILMSIELFRLGCIWYETL